MYVLSAAVDDDIVKERCTVWNLNYSHLRLLCRGKFKNVNTFTIILKYVLKYPRALKH